MLVYQALLLGGYAYAHAVARLAPRKQAGVHLGLFGLAALWLPIGLGAAIPPTDFAPAFWVPWFLVASIGPRSEEHTSELQSLMRNSYAVFCLKQKKKHQKTQ